jgi:hypothetical protein
MNRRKFLSLLPVATMLPGDIITAAAAFAKAAEAKPEIRRKEIIGVTYTYDCAYVWYSDNTCKWIPHSAVPQKWRR